MKCQVPTTSFRHYVPRPITSAPTWGGEPLVAVNRRTRMKVRTPNDLAGRAPTQGQSAVRPRRGTLARNSTGVLTFAILGSMIVPLGLAGQDFWEPLLPKGRLRLEINSSFVFADKRFGQRTEGGSLVEKDEPLGFDFADAAVGTRLFPALEVQEAALATAAGVPIAPSVLGETRAVLTKDAVWLPIRMDVGVFDWLTVGGVLPFSRRRAEFATSFLDSGANVGTRPVDYIDFLGAVATANAGLTAVTTSLCMADPSGPACTQATTLLAEGEGFLQAVGDAYAGHGVFPLTGSATGTALQTRVTALLNAYQSVGVGAFPTAIPLATEVLNETTYLDLVTNPAYGVSGDSLKTWRSPWELGDAELYANARLWGIGQGLGANQRERTLRAVIGAGVLLRLGSGRTDSPRNFIDTGSGHGQNDIEVSVFGKLNVGGRLGVAGDFLYGKQQSVRVLKRISAPDRIFSPASTEKIVRWSPGGYAQLRLSPHVYLTEELAVAFDFRYRRKKSDRYRLDVGETGPDPAVLELETKATSLGIGGGIVYSTARSGRGRPVEARFHYHRAVSGGGGALPKASRFEVGLRFYRGLW